MTMKVYFDGEEVGEIDMMEAVTTINETADKFCQELETTAKKLKAAMTIKGELNFWRFLYTDSMKQEVHRAVEDYRRVK